MKNKKQVIKFAVVIIILFISAINLNFIFETKKVLGIQTVEPENNNISYWKEFIKSNPNYLPGYIQIGEIEKVKRLDPNYLH
jgi:hypothetical protein